MTYQITVTYLIPNGEFIYKILVGLYLLTTIITGMCSHVSVVC